MNTPEIIAVCAERTQKPFLMIGGHAVIAHGHPRTTVDLDLLVCRTERQNWAEVLAAIGYEAEHVHENFEQYRSIKGDIDLDLMFVNEATFEGMLNGSQEFNFGHVPVRIPSLQHLIALKLHVLKQGLEHRMQGDLDDVIQLVLANRVDLDQPEWNHVFERYGDHELYEKVRHATQS
jgi:hypothetical protein